MLSVMAKRLNVSRGVLSRWLEHRPEIEAERCAEVAAFRDLAFSKLIRNVESGDQRAIEFLLSRWDERGKFIPANQRDQNKDNEIPGWVQLLMSERGQRRDK